MLHYLINVVMPYMHQNMSTLITYIHQQNEDFFIYLFSTYYVTIIYHSKSLTRQLHNSSALKETFTPRWDSNQDLF
jgi:hypothetical protein